MQFLLLNPGCILRIVFLFVYCSIVYICNDVLSVVSFFIRNRKCCCILSTSCCYACINHLQRSDNLISRIDHYEKSAFRARNLYQQAFLLNIFFLDAIRSTASARVSQQGLFAVQRFHIVIRYPRVRRIALCVQLVLPLRSVVLFSQFRVAEYLPGLRNLLKFYTILLRSAFVRMKFQCQRAVRTFQVFRGGFFAAPKYLVIIHRGHHRVTVVKSVQRTIRLHEAFTFGKCTINNDGYKDARLKMGELTIVAGKNASPTPLSTSKLSRFPSFPCGEFLQGTQGQSMLSPLSLLGRSRDCG